MPWSRYRILSEISRISRAVLNSDPVVYEVATTTKRATFQINNTKLYVPVVMLSINDNIKFLENIKQGFKRTISWNKYISEITIQPKYNNLDSLFDPTFRNINRVFLLSFKNDSNDTTGKFF